MKQSIKDFSFERLQRELEAEGYPKYRAAQIFDWVHNKKASSFEEMTNLNKDMQKRLEEKYSLTVFSIAKKLVSQKDGSVKYLFALQDGNLVETVLMKYKHGNSVCVSTQVGCKMGCKFCASTKAGFIRNLTPGEIAEQIYAVTRDSGERVSNVVLMGIGEPLDNYDNVIEFLNIISDERGNNLSLRHLSLSTCGLVDKISELAKLRLGLTLSISLHAPNDEIRNETMPINQKYNIKQLIAVCREYTAATSRRISFEYALIKGKNDSKACADELAALLNGMLCHVNLIPINEISETEFKKSDRDNIKKFCEYLNKKGINTTVRRTLGSDIDAACGQLRRSYQQGEATKSCGYSE